MAIKFQINTVNNPLNSDDSDVKVFHYPRAVKVDERNTKDIASIISDESSLTEGDVLACVNALTSQIYRNLMASNCVKLDGLGKFSIKLKATPPIPSDGNPINGSIHIDTINFSPDPELLTRLNTAIFQSVSPEAKQILSLSERMERIRIFLNHKKQANISQITRGTGLNYSTVRSDLALMCADGAVDEKHIGSNKIYEIID